MSPTIVLKDTEELARTVRRVARELKSHRHADITDLNEVAGMLDKIADEERKAKELRA
jgi:hypothetical protein